MTKNIYQIISETPIKYSVKHHSILEKFLEKGILNAFERYSKHPCGALQMHSSQIIIYNIKRLSEIGKAHIAIKYALPFEKEFQ
jgi:hypothetical protein